MQAIVLAAGTGSRLRPLTDYLPKCLLLLDAAGTTLLGRLLRQVLARDVHSVTIVTGFAREKVGAFCREIGVAANYVDNCEYATTNNEYSLWLARDVLVCDDCLILDADVWADGAVFDLLLDPTHPNAIAVSRTSQLGSEEMKVEVDAQGYVTSLAKTSDPGRAYGESTGLQKLAGAAAAELAAELGERVTRRGFRDGYYDASFVELVRRGIRIKAIPIGDLAFIEVDTLEDYQRARALQARE